jgi:hypothetical protein
MVLYVTIQHRNNNAAYCDNSRVWRNENGGLLMYEQWQGMSLLNAAGRQKQLEVPVKVLPNINNEQLLFVMLDFKSARDAMTEKL